MRSLSILGLALITTGCWSGESNVCTNACECRAAINLCIDEAAARVESRAGSDGAHLRERAQVLAAQKRPYAVPMDPTAVDLELCAAARDEHARALQSFPELADCQHATRWDAF
jgi:hypothetical protein